jgi:hypothetical protein
MTNPADQFLLGSKTRSASFETIGDTVTGVILSTAVQQQTDIHSGAPLSWDNGDPRMQLVVRLQTSLREEPDENGIPDDGVRAVYVKGSKKTGTRSMHDAVATAVRQAGGKGLEEGGTLTVTFVGEEPPSQRGLSPRKLWEATYVQPDRAAQSGSFLGTTESATYPPADVTGVPFAATPAAPGPQSKEQDDAFQAWLKSKNQPV